MPLYRREGSPFWWFSFTVNGVRFRGSTGETEKRKAQIVEAEERHLARTRRMDSQAFRLRDALGAYWKERAKGLRSSDTIFVKLKSLREHLGTNTPITEITGPKLLDYRASRRGEGLQAHSINRDFALLRAALRHAQEVHRQEVPIIAWGKIMAPEPPHRIRFLSRDEYARLIDAAQGSLRPIIRFAVETGLRKGNILALNWREIDMSSGRITVMVKGNKRHVVKMTPSVRALLASMGERRGRVFDTTGFRKRWEKAVAKADLDDFRFHDLRHTFASWARMAGADLADICEALGHSNISVTMRYAHIQPDEHVTAFDRVSALFLTHPVTQEGAK